MDLPLAKEYSWKERKNVPIVFSTAKTMKEDVPEGYKPRCDDYFEQAFD